MTVKLKNLCILFKVLCILSCGSSDYILASISNTPYQQPSFYSISDYVSHPVNCHFSLSGVVYVPHINELTHNVKTRAGFNGRFTMISTGLPVYRSSIYRASNSAFTLVGDHQMHQNTLFSSTQTTGLGKNMEVCATKNTPEHRSGQLTGLRRTKTLQNFELECLTAGQ